MGLAGNDRMSERDLVILVVDPSRDEAHRIRELLEFMDTLNVCTALPGEWREAIGERRLEALIVGPDLDDAAVRQLLDEIGNFDPNVPIVMLDAERAA